MREIVVGDTLRMTSTHPFVPESTTVALPTQGMPCVGEYWLDADGDQVLFDLSGDHGDDPQVLAALGSVLDVLRHANPADKAKIYSDVGLRLTYQPAKTK